MTNHLFAVGLASDAKNTLNIIEAWFFVTEFLDWHTYPAKNKIIPIDITFAASTHIFSRYCVAALIFSYCCILGPVNICIISNCSQFCANYFRHDMDHIFLSTRGAICALIRER